MTTSSSPVGDVYIGHLDSGLEAGKFQDLDCLLEKPVESGNQKENEGDTYKENEENEDDKEIVDDDKQDEDPLAQLERQIKDLEHERDTFNLELEDRQWRERLMISMNLTVMPGGVSDPFASGGESVWDVGYGGRCFADDETRWGVAKGVGA
ncbi:hypothetical protein IFR05_004512 [Cadophora sp. M221]|nr:hypothetical protein IFR05_004512 [Cadophora sp. M221]